MKIKKKDRNKEGRENESDRVAQTKKNNSSWYYMEGHGRKLY